jgi:hypothetical protein
MNTLKQILVIQRCDKTVVWVKGLELNYKS